MQTFKQFLSESRTAVVGVEAFIKWADTNAKVYMSGPKFLYRGGSGDGEKGLRLGSSLGGLPRKSANTYNNYTLWFDNHPMFKDWPKRSQAWIAADDRDIAQGFGSAALLIVHDEAKIGVVGDRDLWDAETKISNMTIEEFNQVSESLMTDKHDTYPELVSALKNIDLEDVQRHVEDEGDQSSSIASLYKYMKRLKLDNLYEAWEAVMTPSLFLRNTTGAQVGNHDSDGEVWIEGEVGFIPTIGRMKEADAKRIMEWADQYPELLEELQEHWNAPDWND